MASRLTQRKRRAQVGPSDTDDGAAAMESAIHELSELRLWRDALLKPVEPDGCFDLSVADEKVQLAHRIWAGNYLESMAMLREANPAVVQVLSAQVATTSTTAGQAQVMRMRRGARWMGCCFAWCARSRSSGCRWSAQRYPCWPSATRFPTSSTSRTAYTLMSESH